MSRDEARPPAGALTSEVRHRVAFYETDAMGIVHHANYLRFFERARVQWLDEHDQPYRNYMADGMHFATTHVEIDYRGSTRFDDELTVTTWLEWVRGASLRMAYRVEHEGEVKVTGATEHAAVNDEGRVRRIPRPRREALQKAVGAASQDG